MTTVGENSRCTHHVSVEAIVELYVEDVVQLILYIVIALPAHPR